MKKIAAHRKAASSKWLRGFQMLMPWIIFLTMVVSFLLSLGDWTFSRAGKGKQSWFLGKEVRKVGKLVSRSCRSLLVLYIGRDLERENQC